MPQVGRANLLVGAGGREALTVLVATGLFAYAGVMVLGSLRDKRREAQARAAAARSASGDRRAEVDA